MELPIWNVFLSFLSASLLLWVKVSHDEVKRLGILLSKTKNDMHADINRVIARLDRMDEKLDTFMREQRSALN